MRQEERLVRYDPGLQIEAYRFRGVVQPFPNHFHEGYMVIFLDRGRRRLTCGQETAGHPRQYDLAAGDLVLLNPKEPHGCEPVSADGFDFRTLSIPEEVMTRAVREVTGDPASTPLRFDTLVDYRSELVPLLRELHQLILKEDRDFRKEELFLLLVERWLDKGPAVSSAGEEMAKSDNMGWEEPLEKVCAYLEERYAEPVALEELSAVAGFNKYALIRAFTSRKGITPYAYLTAVRVGEVKKQLERGASPLEAALASGFADQSHLSKVFKRLIGLTPGQYRAIFRQPGEARHEG